MTLGHHVQPGVRSISSQNLRLKLPIESGARRQGPRHGLSHDASPWLQTNLVYFFALFFLLGSSGEQADAVNAFLFMALHGARNNPSSCGEHHGRNNPSSSGVNCSQHKQRFSKMALKSSSLKSDYFMLHQMASMGKMPASHCSQGVGLGASSGTSSLWSTAYHTPPSKLNAMPVKTKGASKTGSEKNTMPSKTTTKLDRLPLSSKEKRRKRQGSEDQCRGRRSGL